MDDTTILGSALGQLGQTAKQTVKQVVKIPEELAKDTGGQIGGAPLRQGSEGQAKPGEPKQENKSQQQWQSDEERVKFLKDLYGSTQPSPEASVSANASADKSEAKPEEQKKLIELRNKLHKENYYDPTFNRPNPPAGGEERPAEKVENEKKKEMVDLQKKEDKKPPPLAAQRAAQRVENLPSAG